MNSNFILALFFVWMLFYPGCKIIERYFDIRKIGAVYDQKELARMFKGELWIYVIVGGILFLTAVINDLLKE